MKKNHTQHKLLLQTLSIDNMFQKGYKKNKNKKKMFPFFGLTFFLIIF